MKSLNFKFYIIIVFVCTSNLFAGGPLSTYKGRAVVWNKQITYALDLGNLGVFNTQTAHSIVKQSFNVWQDVATAIIAFKDSALSVDINISNYDDYLDVFTDGINPIVFDSDGLIIEDYFGSKSEILGFAIAVDVDEDGYYDEGEVVLNGYLSNNFSQTEWGATTVHEIGHFIGLDHTQINGEFQFDKGKTIYIPTMYPQATIDDEPLSDLNPDDIAAVSTLYPALNFHATVGSISGTITYADGSPARGVNVIAISTNDSMMYQISTVSDYYWQNTGFYTISGLTSGNYYVRIEPINPSFIEGSSIGPYAWDNSDISFQNPVIPEFYNGQNESYNPLTDLANERVAVFVSANSTTSNIDFKANGNQFTSILQYHAGLSYVFDLPSEYGDTKYSVRFTPTINTKLKRVEFYIYEKPKNNLTGDTLIVSIHQNISESLGGIPSINVMGTKKIAYSSLIVDSYNTIDFSSLNIPITKSVEFHIVFSTKAKAGNILSFVTDNGTTAPSNRSSLFFNNRWYNFLDENNYGQGYNLAVRAHLDTTGVVINDVKEQQSIPVTFMLFQNYPNPFNPVTAITYELSQEQKITLKIFDILGRHISTLKDGFETAGKHSIVFDGSHLTSGVYFCIFTAGNTRFTKRMMLIK